MRTYEYKALIYLIEGKGWYSLRYWGDSSGKAYGKKEKSTLLAAVVRQMEQLEGALAELDEDGWELVTVSIWTALPMTRQGTAMLRRAVRQGEASDS